MGKLNGKVKIGEKKIGKLKEKFWNDCLVCGIER